MSVVDLSASLDSVTPPRSARAATPSTPGSGFRARQSGGGSGPRPRLTPLAAPLSPIKRGGGSPATPGAPRAPLSRSASEGALRPQTSGASQDLRRLLASRSRRTATPSSSRRVSSRREARALAARVEEVLSSSSSRPESSGSGSARAALRSEWGSPRSAAASTPARRPATSKAALSLDAIDIPASPVQKLVKTPGRPSTSLPLGKAVPAPPPSNPHPGFGTLSPATREFAENFSRKILARIKGGPQELLRAFKFVDQGRKGVIELHDFKSAVAAFGMALPDDEMQQLFDYYTDNTGLFRYHQFVNRLIPPTFQPKSLIPMLGCRPDGLLDPAHVATIERQAAVFDSVSTLAASRDLSHMLRDSVEQSVSGNSQMRRAFRRFCEDKRGYISFEEFRKALLETYMLPFEESHVRTLFHQYDAEGKGFISYRQFIVDVMKNNISFPFLDAFYDKDKPDFGAPPQAKIDIDPVNSKPKTPKTESPVETAERKLREGVRAKAMRHGGSLRTSGKDLVRAFRRFQLNGSAEITLHELGSALREYVPGAALSDAEVRLLFAKYCMDTPDPDTINYQIFAHAVMMDTSAYARLSSRPSTALSTPSSVTPSLEAADEADRAARAAEAAQAAARSRDDEELAAARHRAAERIKAKRLAQLRRENRARLRGMEERLREAFLKRDTAATHNISIAQFFDAITECGITEEQVQSLLFTYMPADPQESINYSHFVKDYVTHLDHRFVEETSKTLTVEEEEVSESLRASLASPSVAVGGALEGVAEEEGSEDQAEDQGEDQGEQEQEHHHPEMDERERPGTHRSEVLVVSRRGDRDDAVDRVAPRVIMHWKPLRQAFRDLDKKRTGFATCKQLRRAFKKAGIPISREDAHHITNGGERVKYNVFIRTLLRQQGAWDGDTGPMFLKTTLEASRTVDGVEDI